MSNVAVPSGCKIHGASDVFSRCERDLRCSVVDVGFDLRFDVGFQFLSQAVDDFDSVVIERVVAGRNHNAAIEVIHTGDVGHRRSGGDMEQVSICTGSRQTSHQTVFKHIGATTRIFTDNDTGRLMVIVAFTECIVIPAKKAPYLVGVVGG